MNDALVFDVNETLLDLGALLPRFESEVGDAGLLPVWFGQMLRNSLVATLTRAYRPFDELGVDALLHVTMRAGRGIDEVAARRVVGEMRELPPHPDVRPALERLKDAGYPIVTLTNSSSSMVHDQIRNAGLADLFDDLYSVELVRMFKPAPETYLSAADRLGRPIGELRLVAAHEWDVTGAIRAGARAAFVARPGMMLTGVSEHPDVIGDDLGAVADQLLIG
ncbi:MAG: haloacid dehalogenase type II [Acidimicrobiia bacterium]|nr:haloacid dehalogenase type II [Acidimicrobiia bacterium]